MMILKVNTSFPNFFIEQETTPVNQPPKVPYIVKVLYSKITYKIYLNKLNNPNWIYKNVHLCDQCYDFVKDISDVMMFNKVVKHDKKQAIKIGIFRLVKYFR
jgi:hypothetical protein